MKKILTTIMLAILIISMGYAQKPDMVDVEGGEFYMGNINSGEADESPEHKITLSDFSVAKKEVTFDEYDLFCKNTSYPLPDDGGFGRGQHPVMNVSWMGAVLYCNWLSKKHRFDKYYLIESDSSGTVQFKGINTEGEGNGYRLPTEAEWEYMATGGAESEGYAYAGSNVLQEVAWYAETTDARPHEVGTAKANELGIFDLNGNAWEWCYDYYGNNYYGKSPEENPTGPEEGDSRVYRGGSFNSAESFCRTTRRFNFAQNIHKGSVGFRLIKSGK